MHPPIPLLPGFRQGISRHLPLHIRRQITEARIRPPRTRPTLAVLLDATRRPGVTR